MSYSQRAKEIFELQIDELKILKEKINSQFEKAVESILNSKGKIVIMGVGKSGLIGQKLASTLTSTGNPAHFIHPTEALHGDLGLITKGDVVFLISYSGNSDEITQLIPHLREKENTIIAFTGALNSNLAKESDFIIDIGITKESSRLQDVPMTSTTGTLVMGDAIAAILMEAKQFEEQDFAAIHPGGGIGKRLKYKVGELMHPIDKIAHVYPDSQASEIIAALNEISDEDTGIYVGSLIVVDHKGIFKGFISFGDLRKALSNMNQFSNKTASDFMNPSPVTISPNDKAIDALRIMENRDRPLTDLPVVENGKAVGLIKIHDLLGKVK